MWVTWLSMINKIGDSGIGLACFINRFSHCVKISVVIQPDCKALPTVPGGASCNL